MALTEAFGGSDVDARIADVAISLGESSQGPGAGIHKSFEPPEAKR